MVYKPPKRYADLARRQLDGMAISPSGPRYLCLCQSFGNLIALMLKLIVISVYHNTILLHKDVNVIHRKMNYCMI